jgi:SAM-dependent methyltransferase
MRVRALDVFVCPACHGALRVRRKGRGEDIVEGDLTCLTCGSSYPITNGIPRFVSTERYAQSFASQWQWFRTVQMDSSSGCSASDATLRATTGWRDDEYIGRRLLDAGVGAGRFAERAAAKGAEVFGIDVTTAVDAAYRNIGALDNVHLAQADVLALPFRDETFDLAYSIGVLHHTPDPPAAFASVARALAPGGKLAVYVYARYGPSHRSSDAIRVLTTHLPLRLTWVLSSVAVPLYWLYRVPVVGRLCAIALPISMEPKWRWRWLDTFDWYSPTHQSKHLYPEVFRWFTENGFTVVGIPDGPIRMSGVKTREHEQAHARTRRDTGLVAS